MLDIQPGLETYLQCLLHMQKHCYTTISLYPITVYLVEFSINTNTIYVKSIYFRILFPCDSREHRSDFLVITDPIHGLPQPKDGSNQRFVVFQYTPENLTCPLKRDQFQ